MGLPLGLELGLESAVESTSARVAASTRGDCRIQGIHEHEGRKPVEYLPSGPVII